MKIKNVEELVGITQKNIRFYEDQGLLSVERAQNGYREYSLTDVERLKQIKLLRLINVPIEDIRLLYSNKKSLDDILDSQVVILTQQKDNTEKMISFCKSLADKDLTLETLDADACLESINQLEKEGAKFMDINKTDIHLKKKLGALLGTVIISIFCLLYIGVFIYVYLTEADRNPIILALISIPVIIIICIIVAFIQRTKEIEGGEEDEASKY